MKRIFLFVVALGVASTPAGAEILQSNAQRLFQSPSGQWYFECTIERRGVDVNGSFSTTLILDSPDGALQFDSVLSNSNSRSALKILYDLCRRVSPRAI